MTRRRHTTRRRKTNRRRRTGGLLNPSTVVKPRPEVVPLGGYGFQKRLLESMKDRPLKGIKFVVPNQTKGFPAIQPHVEAWSKLQKGWRR